MIFYDMFDIDGFKKKFLHSEFVFAIRHLHTFGKSLSDILVKGLKYSNLSTFLLAGEVISLIHQNQELIFTIMQHYFNSSCNSVLSHSMNIWPDTHDF